MSQVDAPRKTKPSPGRTRTVEDLFVATPQEQTLVALVTLALIYAAHPRDDTPGQEYIAQLDADSVTTGGLAEFAELLARHPHNRDWQDQLVEQLTRVTPARARIILTLVILPDDDTETAPLAGPVVRRMDAILDLIDLPASAADVEATFAAFAQEIAEAKVSAAAEVGITAGSLVSSGVAGFFGHPFAGARVAAKTAETLRGRLATPTMRLTYWPALPRLRAWPPWRRTV